MRRWGAAALAAVFGTASIFATSAAPAKAEEPALTPTQRFAACVSGGGQGNILMLFDTSGSLAETDPEGARVTAAARTVEELAGKLGTVSEAEVSIAVAGFANKFVKSKDWTPLNAEQLPAINEDLQSYVAKDNGGETDYWTALDGARREFAARAQNQDSSCNMLLWFSDGGFAVAKRRDAAMLEEWGGPKAWAPDNKLQTQEEVSAAVSAGAKDMCRAGGLADQLRSLDIITIGIGLAVDTEASTFDLMSNFSTGADCGEVTTPVPGEFIMSTDVDELIYNFITSLGGGDGQDTKPCVADVCAEGTRTFVLDGSIGGVSATAKAPIDGTRVYLKTLKGEYLELTQGDGEEDLGSSTLKWEWATDRVVTFDLTRVGQGEWAGPWGIVFVAGEQTDELAKSTISLRGDIAPVLANRAEIELRVGEQPVELKLGAVDRDGTRIDPTTLSDQTKLSAQLRSGGEVITLAEGLAKADIERPIKVDPSTLKPGVAELVLTLDVTTQAWQQGNENIPGTKLEPRHASIPLTVAAPANYPSIPARISFGSTETADPVTAQLAISGDGCVWLDESAVKFTGVPSADAKPKLTSSANSLESCVSGSLPLTLAPDLVANGLLAGEAQVLLIPKDSTAEPVQATVAFELEQLRPASQPVLWTTLILVTLLGIAIPVAILYLTKYLTAKIPGSGVLAGTARGPVTDASAFTDGGVPIKVTELAVAHLTNRRSVTVAGKTLTAKMGLAPTEPGYVVVETAGLSAGGRGRVTETARGNAKLPLAVQGNWMVELDPQHPVSGPVEVTVFAAPGAPKFDALLDDVRSNLRTAVAKLREGLPPEATPPNNNPWTSTANKTVADPWSTPAQPGSQWTGQPARPQGQAPTNNPWTTPPASGSTQTSGGWPTPPANPGNQPRPPGPAGPPADPWNNPKPPAGPPSGPSTW